MDHSTKRFPSFPTLAIPPFVPTSAIRSDTEHVNSTGTPTNGGRGVDETTAEGFPSRGATGSIPPTMPTGAVTSQSKHVEMTGPPRYGVRFRDKNTAEVLPSAPSASVPEFTVHRRVCASDENIESIWTPGDHTRSRRERAAD